ncbi:SIR2 family protein [Treponema sp. R80B11-R83G3]
MSNNFIIITGAGISNLFGLPLTSGFTSLIKDSSKYQMNGLLSNYLGNGISDIEKVMFTLEEFLDDENNNLQKHILEAQEYFPSISSSTSGHVNNIIYNTYKNIKENAYRYLLSLKTGIYNTLDNNNIDIEKACTLYINILSIMKKKYPDSKISIFTTNYDLSFENVCRREKGRFKKVGIDTDAINYGFIPQSDIFVFNPKYNDIERKPLEYYKLHGSLDWHYDDLNNCTKSGANAYPSNPEKMPILYPGVKGRPKKEPFISLHNIFFERLQTVDMVIVLGFAFRDPYINDLIKISKMTNKKFKMLYFNPNKIEELPQESGIHDFKNIFKDDLQYVTSKIEVSGDPLNDYLN